MTRGRPYPEETAETGIEKAEVEAEAGEEAGEEAAAAAAAAAAAMTTTIPARRLYALKTWTPPGQSRAVGWAVCTLTHNKSVDS